MARQLTPTIQDDLLVVGDIPIAPASDVASVTTVQTSGTSRGNIYRVRKTDGTVKILRVMGTQQGASDSGDTYTKEEMDQILDAVNEAIDELNEKAPCLPSGSMDATSTSTAFTAQVEGIDELRDGTCVILYNGVVASAEGCTLDINGLGAKPIYNTTSGSTRITTGVAKNYTYLFIYRAALGDDGGWRLGQIFNSNDNTIAYQIRRNYGPYAAAAAIYRYQICFAYSETSVLPVSKTSNRTAATKTLTDLDFDPFGPILYYNSTTTVALGSNAGVGNMWEARDLDLRYSFNVTTLTNGKNVYVRCSPVISNGLPTGRVTLDADPIAQDLPTTDDGYIYILLGRAFDDYKLYLVLHHPVYYWKDGGIRLWDGGRSDAL